MNHGRKPTRLDLRHLRYALAVADAQGFRAAAEMLNIAQPAISKAVKDTEVDLGFRIFDRSGPRVIPTPEGVVFLDDARQTVAQFERTIRASRQNAAGARGHIIVGYSALATSRQISEALDAFHRSVPGVQVEMHVIRHHLPSPEEVLRGKSLQDRGLYETGRVITVTAGRQP